ncbi:MAG: SDR family NAD(P)-dependent oxidoreductase [Bacteroidetes bacterium]|nr:SDR family NAD(P)-dependent oxidoreductase [Bacteroidota bacterium]
MTFNFEQLPSLSGKIAIVTGANAGLGFETVKWFVQKDIKVIMACRSMDRAENARNKILEEFPEAKLEIRLIDLSSLDSVRAFAESFLAEYDKLDLLINNAGIMIPPYSKTEDGFESQMGANYFGHFLLTNLLLPLLNKTAGARVVTLSSNAHRNGKIHFDDLHWEENYSRTEAYGQSKLACLMFALELQRRLDADNQDTLSLAAHPGISNTELGKYIPRILYYLLYPLFIFMTHAPKKGALPTVMAALKPEVDGGSYFGPQGSGERTGKPGLATIYPQAKDEEAAKRLWTVSEALTGLR